MSTIDVNPNKVKRLNTTLLPIAAVMLLVLALLFVATPLLRVSGLQGRSGFNRQFTGQTTPGGQNGIRPPGTDSQGQGFSSPNGGFQGQGNSANPNRQFAGRNSLLRLSFLSGITGTIVYALLLLVALAAALGMFLARRWGQILGIFMAVIYLLLSLLSFLPLLLLGFARALNGLSLGLTIVHLVLAIAVIVLAVIPAKKMMTPPMPVTPAAPPAASA
jgi:hypothetical protein